MPLTVLVALVGGGIALVILLVHLTGGSRKAELDRDLAVKRFAEDFEGLAVENCLISQERSEALLLLGDGTIGLVHVVGSMELTRRYEPAEFAAMAHWSGDRTLELRPGEMTLPKTITFKFAGAEVRAELMAILGRTANRLEQS